MHVYYIFIFYNIESGGAKYTFLLVAVAIGRYTISHTYHLKSMISQLSNQNKSILKLYKNQIKSLLVNLIGALYYTTTIFKSSIVR